MLSLSVYSLHRNSDKAIIRWMQSIEFYQNHLNKVSRSFSFCIARLDHEMRLWVSISYLLCRILDCIEDASWICKSDQEATFNDFDDFVKNRPEAIDFHEWIVRFPKNMPLFEIQLIEDSHAVFSDLHSLPENIKKHIVKTVIQMSFGMRKFVLQNGSNQKIKLSSIQEVNIYCYFVAGVVGELLSALLMEKHTNSQFKFKNLTHQYQFGLFLQKINILKDQKTDESEGRYLVHSREDLLSSLSSNADGALQYLLDIPICEKGYRLFCAWSLFLGLSMLPFLRQTWLKNLFSRMPRKWVEKKLKHLETIIDDNENIGRFFSKRMPRNSIFSRSPHNPKKVLTFAELSANYNLILPENSLQELGLVGR